jgi:hypothetical protein
MALEACPEATRTLFAWIIEAWRNTIPDMDMSSVEAEVVQWRIDEAIKLVRKVGILNKIYHPEIRTPLEAPVSRDMKKIIINGAPAHLKMTLTTALALAETLQDITDFIKEVRNLEKCKVLSFPLEKKREAKWPPKQLMTFVTEVQTYFRCGRPERECRCRQRQNFPTRPQPQVTYRSLFPKNGESSYGSQIQQRPGWNSWGQVMRNIILFGDPNMSRGPRPETYSWGSRLWGQPAQRPQMSGPTSNYQHLSMDRPTS